MLEEYECACSSTDRTDKKYTCFGSKKLINMLKILLENVSENFEQ